MSARDTVRMLALGAVATDAADWRRQQARVAWVRRTVTALRAAQRRVDQAWSRILAALPDDLSEEELVAIPHPPEQAHLDALYAQLRTVIDEDHWPRELYFGGL